MTQQIICAGFGGQGIMLLGKFIAYGAMKNNLHTTWMPSYGAEVRGGTAHCMIIVSDEEIASPIFVKNDISIVLNGPSLNKFLPRLKPEGTLILDSSLVDTKIERSDIKVVNVPMSEIAHELGNVRVANIIALGAYLKISNLFPKDHVLEGLEMAFPGKKELVDLNMKALEKGLSIDV